MAKQNSAQRQSRARSGAIAALPSGSKHASRERGSTDDAAQTLDIRGLQRRLEEHVVLGEPTVERDAVATPKGTKAALNPMIRRVGKVLLGAAVVAVFGLVPLRTLLQTSSVEAVVNARIMTLRAPIAGEIVAAPADLAASEAVPAGKTLLHIVNPRADRGRLDDLRRSFGQLTNQRKGVEAKLAAARLAEADLAGQAEKFRLGRIEQLVARVAEQESLIVVAGARREEAVAARDRSEALSRTGNVTAAEFARLTREVTAMTETETSARHRLAALNVELTAARAGLFLGDSYNDRPSSVQRGDEMRQRIVDLEADLAGIDAELERLGPELEAEQARYRASADVAMTLPVAGRIWETMVSPGEQVRVGQDLVRLVDCSTAIVTANVTESVYNRLSVGSTARFIPADGGKELQGRVVNLTGLAGAPANLAIEPAALSKEPYRVTVSLPGLGSQACGVGRTGRVVFGE
ncbi:MAG: HlyD family secretion protein [Chelatococcus sp.]|nr:MAG: HlyD family secretion protein [Chelatococcus sp.]